MIKSVFKSGFLQIIGFGAGFAAHILLARFLSVEEYGQYNFIFAFSSVLAMIAMFGLPQANIRLIQDYQSKNNKAALRGLLSFNRAFPVLFGLGLGLIGYAALFQFTTQSLDMIVFAAGVALVPLMATLRVHSSVLRGFERISASVFYEVTYRDVVFALVLLSGILLPFAGSALLSVALVIGLGALAACAHGHYVTQKNLHDIKPEFEVKRWLLLAAPMMLTVATRVLMVRTDLIILGLMVSAFDLGIYSAAAKFAMLMALAQMAVMPFFAPKAAKFFAHKKPQELRSLFFKAQGLQVVGGAILFLGFFIAGKTILGFLGTDYMAGYSVFMILVIGQLIGAACGPCGALLQMSAYEKTVMKVVMMFAGLNLVLTPLLILFHGLEGAALATSIAFVGQNFACYALAWRRGLIGLKNET